MVRCLILPVGEYLGFILLVVYRHSMKKGAKRGVHYAPLQCMDVRSNAVSVVEMVEDEAHVTFRVTA